MFNRLWKLIDVAGADYFGGPRFLDMVREFHEDVPPYGELMEQRREWSKSTSRKDYFYDVLMELPEGRRRSVVNDILGELVNADADARAGIRAAIGGVGQAPSARIPAEAWNAERLNAYLTTIDAAIAAGDYPRAVALSYTCLEGFTRLSSAPSSRARSRTATSPTWRNGFTDICARRLPNISKKS